MMLSLATQGVIVLAFAGTALGVGNRFDGAYAGVELLTKGSAPPCVPTGNVTATIGGDNLKFVTSQSHEYPLRARLEIVESRC
jgi:hypothetical protein